jgi:hypothetical protein
MWWSYWPTTWFLFMPLMMVACMAGMFLMTRAMHGRHHPNSAGIGPGIARTGERLTAPEEALPFEEYRAATLRRLDREQADFRGFAEGLRTAKDKAEFDEFMARLDARATPPPTIAVDGGAHGR